MCSRPCSILLAFFISVLAPISQCRVLLTLGEELPTQTLEHRSGHTPWLEMVSSTQAHLAVRVDTASSPTPLTTKPAVVVVGSQGQQYLQIITYPPVVCGFFEVAPIITLGVGLITDPATWM